MFSKFFKFIATLGPVGYFPAPGTVASIIAIPAMMLIRSYIVNDMWYLSFSVLFCLLSILLINGCLQNFKRANDPSEIVLDEVVGVIITFWAIPITTQSIIIGLILFRFFDILKLGWIKKAEKLVGGWGIVFDDVVAALISNVLLRLIF